MEQMRKDSKCDFVRIAFRVVALTPAHAEIAVLLVDENDNAQEIGRNTHEVGHGAVIGPVLS